MALDGTKSDVTTYYDPAALSTILEQITVNTNCDGRTITTTQESDDDQLTQSFDSQTPSFSGSGYNVETDTLSSSIPMATPRKPAAAPAPLARLLARKLRMSSPMPTIA